MVTHDMMSYVRLHLVIQSDSKTKFIYETPRSKATKREGKEPRQLTLVLSSTTRRPSAETHNTALTVFFPLWRQKISMSGVQLHIKVGFKPSFATIKLQLSFCKVLMRTDEVVKVSEEDGQKKKKNLSRGAKQAGLITHSAWSRVKIPRLKKTTTCSS